jgi:hypothetical protein
MVPHRYDVNPALGQWVKRQRYQYKLKNDWKQSAMTDFGFVWNSNSSVWEERFSELTEYKELHGHCSISKCEIPHLGVWAKVQRRQYALYMKGFNNKGNQHHHHHHKSNMTPERIAKLESLGFNWNLRKSSKSKLSSQDNDVDVDVDTSDDEEKDFDGGTQDARLWNERLHQMKLFRENHGHCAVPQYLPLGMGHAPAI